MKYYNTSLRTLLQTLTLTLVLGGTLSTLQAEGVKQLAPNPPYARPPVMLEINNKDYGYFAGPSATNTSPESRLYFTIEEAGEVINLGLSVPYSVDGNRLAGENYFFRIKNASNTTVVAETEVNETTDNVVGYDMAEYGNYAPTFSYSIATPGDYYIEFYKKVNSNLPSSSTSFRIGYWDITVSQNNEAILGRVWSRNWAFRTPYVDLNDGSDEECIWDRPFEGVLYSYTGDDANPNGFVSRIDFNNSGFQGLAFNVAFNSRGPGGGDEPLDLARQSRDGNATANSAEYRVFLNPPDPTVFLSDDSICGSISTSGELSCEADGIYCIDVQVTQPGQVELILDFDNDGAFTAGTRDTSFLYQISAAGDTCLEFPGLYRNGDPVDFGVDFTILYVYSQGVQHYAVYDVEYLKNGFSVQTIRPSCADAAFRPLYWDDRRITAVDPLVQYMGNPPRDGRAGYPTDGDTLRIWNNFSLNQICAEGLNPPGVSDDNITTGYGNDRTINTWWFATVETVQVANIVLPGCMIEGANSFCVNGSATLTVNVAGVVPPLSYAWEGPDGFTSDQDEITVTVPGDYSVTVTDSNGCTTTCSQTLSADGPVIDEAGTTVTNADCDDPATGAIDLVVTGGTLPYTYAWSNGATTEDLSGLTPGDYSVTVTDDSGCDDMATFTISQPAGPLIDEAATTVINATCANPASGAIDLVVIEGTPPYTFAWSNGATTEDLTALAPGTYSVTVTDANDCTDEATFMIILSDGPLIDEEGTTVTDADCDDPATGAIDLVVTGGTLPYTFAWSNGATTEDLTGLTPGDYSVTVTDANLCTDEATFTVVQPQPPVIDLAATAVTDADCDTDNGSIDLVVIEGTPPYTFAWSNGATTEDLTALAPGTYSVTVTDANDCTDEATFTVNQANPPVIDLEATAVTDADCDTDNGSIDLVVIEGTPPYTFEWSNDATTEDLMDLAPGTYSVTVTDANLCTDEATFTVNQAEPPVIDEDGTIVTNATCEDPAAGSIDLVVTGGTLPYTFEWSNGATTENLDGLMAGTYSVTVTDANTCQDSASFTIELPESPMIDEDGTVVTNATCEDPAAGSIDLVVSGGTPPYTFEWSNGATTEDLDGLMAGTYSVTVTDVNTCRDSATFVIELPEPPVIDEEGTLVIDADCDDPATGEIDLVVFGGTPPYTFAWSNGATTEDLVGLTPGDYSVTVTDVNDCKDEATFTVDQPESPMIDGAETFIIDANCADPTDGEIDLTVFGGTEPYTFEWSNGATTEDLAGLSPGDYSVTVTDGNGCTDEGTFTVGVSEPPICDADRFFIPTGFTPNGDNLNDDIRLISASPIEEMELMIYNRWGEEVFRTTNPNEAWDGTFRDDQLPPDVYGFYLRVACPCSDGEELIQKGNITLIR